MFANRYTWKTFTHHGCKSFFNNILINRSLILGVVLMVISSSVQLQHKCSTYIRGVTKCANFSTLLTLVRGVSSRWSSKTLNLHSLILLLMMVWSRENINTSALVTIVQCNTLVARCSRQLTGPADWVFVTLGPLRCD